MKCGWHKCDNCDNFLILERRQGALIFAQKGAVNYRLPSGISRQNIEDDYEVDVFFTILSLLMLGACTPTEFDMEKDVFERQLTKVRLGLSFDDSQDLFPQSISRGGDRTAEGMMTAFEVAYDYYSFHATGNTRRNDFTGTERVVVWFFFLDGLLMRYGEPEVWPAPRELRRDQ